MGPRRGGLVRVPRPSRSAPTTPPTGPGTHGAREAGPDPLAREAGPGPLARDAGPAPLALPRLTLNRAKGPSQGILSFAFNNRRVDERQEPLRVLVVDDEPNIVDVVSMALRHNGFAVDATDTGAGALARAREWRPSVMVLDVMLPDMNGFEVARRLSGEHLGVPILFLSARDATSDKVRGLTTGGDDYVTKPFSIEELVARLRNILRRTGALTEQSGRLTFADLELDEDTREVSRNGHPIELTATEYRLLRYLMLNPRRVLTRAQLLDHVWRYDFAGDARVLETYMSYLRKKIDADHVPLLHTVRGVGYTLRLPRE